MINDDDKDSQLEEITIPDPGPTAVKFVMLIVAVLALIVYAYTSSREEEPEQPTRGRSLNQLLEEPIEDERLSLDDPPPVSDAMFGQ